MRAACVGKSVDCTRGCLFPSVLIVAWLFMPGDVTLADAPLAPLASPQYSFDLASPSVLDGSVVASDVLELGFPFPAAYIKGNDIGLLSPQDDIDALSSGHSGMNPDSPFLVQFSVDRETVGLAPPDVSMIDQGIPFNVFDQALRNHAAGDQFLSFRAFGTEGNDPTSAVALPTSVSDFAIEINAPPTANNVLVRNNFDEGGTDFAAYPITHADTSLVGEIALDRVDAHAVFESSQADPFPAVFFSLTTDSPSLVAISRVLPASGANVFVAQVAGSETDIACCFGDTQCQELPRDGCIAIGGVPSQLLSCDDAVCLPGGIGPLPAGACCLADQSCLDGVELIPCLEQGGVPNPAATCAETSCTFGNQQVGACCGGDGTCTDNTTISRCSGGAFGPNQTCEQLDCTNGGIPAGACCTTAGGCADDESILDCISVGGLPFPEMACDVVQCAPISAGACCEADGTCSDGVAFDVCHGRGGVPVQGAFCDEQLCAGGPVIEQSGACCAAVGCVEDVTVMNCLLGGGFPFPDLACGAVTCDMGQSGTPGMGGVNPVDGMLVAVFAGFEDLGLQQGDDIDALVVVDADGDHTFTPGDHVYFSLTPSSPSLGLFADASKIGAAADVFVVEAGGEIRVMARANELGLGAATDNVDALELLTVGANMELLSPQVQHGIRADVGTKFQRRASFSPIPIGRDTQAPVDFTIGK